MSRMRKFVASAAVIAAGLVGLVGVADGASAGPSSAGGENGKPDASTVSANYECDGGLTVHSSSSYIGNVVFRVNADGTGDIKYEDRFKADTDGDGIRDVYVVDYTFEASEVPDELLSVFIKAGDNGSRKTGYGAEVIPTEATGCSPEQRCAALAETYGLVPASFDHVIAGTDDDDVYDDFPNFGDSNLICGFGGDDYVNNVSSYGDVFLGGDGSDTVESNYGTFYGGDGNDRVFFNVGVFYGGDGDDELPPNSVNRGEFYGEGGCDAVNGLSHSFALFDPGDQTGC